MKTIDLSNPAIATLHWHWWRTGELTVTSTRELLPDVAPPIQKAAFLAVQDFVGYHPELEAPPLEGSVAEAVMLMECIETPDAIDGVFEHIGNRALQEAAWKALPKPEQARLRPIFAAWKRGQK